DDGRGLPTGRVQSRFSVLLLYSTDSEVRSFANLRDAVIETQDVTENAMLIRPS
ncbi:unnamed protein product, partial [Ascophyllum nodosum]